jgi:hypothetical protein
MEGREEAGGEGGIRRAIQLQQVKYCPLQLQGPSMTESVRQVPVLTLQDVRDENRVAVRQNSHIHALGICPSQQAARGLRKLRAELPESQQNLFPGNAAARHFRQHLPPTASLGYPELKCSHQTGGLKVLTSDRSLR